MIGECANFEGCEGIRGFSEGDRGFSRVNKETQYFWTVWINYSRKQLLIFVTTANQKWRFCPGNFSACFCSIVEVIIIINFIIIIKSK